ncbi:unnamed protein product [Dibothriocephalus latus]|uniref:Rubicon Homology domain-containing protein n=1 Tax=Dibothriocephalus latus TaxID=60516 RepID=A0A3P7NR21_DIBLA|nr:unnamed protein product [Dibothriocephalus latus]
MRFCEYFGCFFCCTCHTNTLMVVPSAVLYHWSFLMLPVSNFARDILCRLHSRPVIHLADFQAIVLRREHVLRDAIELRRQASRMVPFLRLCREELAYSLLSAKADQELEFAVEKLSGIGTHANKGKASVQSMELRGPPPESVSLIRFESSYPPKILPGSHLMDSFLPSFSD